MHRPSHRLGIRSSSLSVSVSNAYLLCCRGGIFGSRDRHPLPPTQVPHHCESRDNLDSVTSCLLSVPGPQQHQIRCRGLLDPENEEVVISCLPSASLMSSRSSMEERNKLLRIYGPDLCAEEANAVANMMRMFSLSSMYEDTDDDDAFESAHDVNLLPSPLTLTPPPLLA
jgi:hypothetical protein